jgi:hypothetical protein
VQTLSAPAAAFGFGSAVTVANGVIVVGAPREDQGGFTAAGAVHSFALNGVGAWTGLQRIGCPQPAVNRAFGSSVAIGQSTLVVGAPGGSGGVYLSAPAGGGSFASPVLRDSCTEAVDGALGAALAVDGRAVLAGAPDSQAQRGRARMYLLPPPCVADIFADGRVDGADLAVLLTRWGAADASGLGDLDGDGLVAGADLAIMLSSWGPCP